MNNQYSIMLFDHYSPFVMKEGRKEGRRGEGEKKKEGRRN
jgi:hypothetical protein